MRKPFILALVLAMGTTVPLSGLTGMAAASSDLETLDRHMVAGAGWAAWRIALPLEGGTIWWSFEGNFSDSQHTHWSHFTLEHRGPVDSDVGGFIHHMNLWNMEHVEDEDGVVRSWTNGSSYELRGLAHEYSHTWPVGEYTLIMMAMSDGRFDGNFTVKVSPGAELLGKTSGERAFAYAEWTFDGPKVVKRVPGEPHELSVSGVEKTFEIENRFFGAYRFLATSEDFKLSWEAPPDDVGTRSVDVYASRGGSGRAGIATPLGSEGTMWGWAWAKPFLGSPPGQYIMRIDEGEQIQRVNKPFVWVEGADVIMP